jgi:hypothetical protein
MLLSIHDGRIQEYNKSIKILSFLEFDTLLPGHLSISLNNGKEHIKKASSYFEKGMIPPNIIYGYVLSVRRKYSKKKKGEYS